jgi:predicted dinucleotide-binding enzyme
MFADDKNISTNGKTNDELQERIIVDLQNVHQWLLANKLTLNKDKTEYIIIGSRQRISNLVTDHKIELGRKSKTLGVIIDEHLLWNHQIQNTVTKASKGIGLMRRIKQFVPKSTLVKIYNAIVLSHFDYCSLVWDNCCDYLKNKLQKLQNRAARIITGKTL